MKPVLILTILAALLLTACVAPPAPQSATPAGPTKLTLAMGYIPSVQFAPF